MNKIIDKKIKITKNGPYVVSGAVPLQKEIIVADEQGMPVKWEKGEKYPIRETYRLCRCGQSKNKPFCDGTHAKVGFDGTETADREKYIQQAGKIEGPDLVMTDQENLCVLARFCHRAGDAWTFTENSDDPQAKEIAIKNACDCPSGRLVAWDKKTGKSIEPELEPSISLIEDPVHKVSGPLWVKGGIPIESEDGTKYEIRNRVTLCRCGKSQNKPFCDATHVSIGFNDGDESLK